MYYAFKPICCTYKETKLRAESKSHVRQHLKTPKHQKSMQTLNCGQISTNFN
jgi:hypothetical protein